MNAVRTSSLRARKPYPNAADRSYFLEKTVDSILTAAICVGVVSILFFLITGV